MIDLKKKRVLVTGHHGMLGGRLCHFLAEEGAVVLTDGPKARCDLANTTEARRLFRSLPGIDYVIHAAGWNGGIEWNRKYPHEVFARSTMMGLNVIQNCVEQRAAKVVSLVASCAYPAPGWDEEDDKLEEYFFLGGEADKSVACHGYAKRNLFLASKFASEEHGLCAVTVCPPTLYGPGDRYCRDRSKVVAAMVKRFADAAEFGDGEVVCWGSGGPLREVCYVDDCARLVIQSLKQYDDASLPLNVGTGQELSVREIAERCALGVSYKGKITWDAGRPDGAYRKRLDLARMNECLAATMTSSTPFVDGLAKTIEDYKERFHP